MRDLSKTTISRERRPFKRILILFGGVGLVVAIVYFFSSTFGSIGSGGNITLHDAPTNLKPVDTPGGVSAEDGVNLKTEKASFKDVKFSGGASATATRAYGGGVYSLTVEANLPDPQNTYYQVWLIGGGSPLPIDYMRGSKTSWSLSLRDSDKYSKYRGIWITLERTKDSLPEEHVLEGSF